jgi:hypothetical protein
LGIFDTVKSVIGESGVALAQEVGGKLLSGGLPVQQERVSDVPPPPVGQLPVETDFSPSTAGHLSVEPVFSSSGDNIYEYKVVTQMDSAFGGKFSPKKIEKVINLYAAEGWKVVSAVSTNFPGFAAHREELVFILERRIS